MAGYGIAVRIEQIALMPAIGLNIAIMMLMSQNNGAKKYDRLAQVYYTGIRYGIYVILPMFFVILFFSEELMRLFPNTSPESVQIGSYYLQISAFLLLGYVLIFMTTSGLQGIKKPFVALVVGVVRQIILPLPIWYLCVSILGLGISSIWWGLFGIIWTSAIVTTIYMLRVLHRLKNE